MSRSSERVAWPHIQPRSRRPMRSGARTFAEGTTRIGQVHRIAADIGVEVHPVAISDRIGLHEPVELGVAPAVLVIIEAELGIAGLAGVEEGAGIAAAPAAIFVVAVGDDRVAVAVGRRDDRASLVGVEEAPGDSARAVPDERLVHAWTVNEPTRESARGMIFREQLVSVIDAPPPARPGKLVEAGQRIVGERVAGRCPRYRYSNVALSRSSPACPSPS